MLSPFSIFGYSSALESTILKPVNGISCARSTSKNRRSSNIVSCAINVLKIARIWYLARSTDLGIYLGYYQSIDSLCIVPSSFVRCASFGDKLLLSAASSYHGASLFTDRLTSVLYENCTTMLKNALRGINVKP